MLKGNGILHSILNCQFSILNYSETANAVG
jgi:hypothetical protein